MKKLALYPPDEELKESFYKKIQKIYSNQKNKTTNKNKKRKKEKK